jgi:hypothetical protein
MLRIAAMLDDSRRFARFAVVGRCTGRATHLRLSIMPDERLHFALDVLNGEPDAHRIVADLLEEQGEAGLADWARGRKNNGRKRLEFAISLLPVDAAVRLGCDFVEHALDRQRRSFRSVPQIIHAVAAIREAFQVPHPAAPRESSPLAWAEYLTSGELLNVYAETNISPWERQFAILFEIRAGLEELAQSVRHASSAEERRRVGNERKAVHLEHQARIAIRKLARRMREASLSMSTGRPETPRRRFFGLLGGRTPDPATDWDRSSSSKSDELRWQMERAREAIEELLNERATR